MKVKLKYVSCLRCGAVWTPRKVDVRRCPKCGSAVWDTPRKEKNENQAN
jgi:DNA-directed RNA polymerase subunit RPC12/RpoP